MLLLVNRGAAIEATDKVCDRFANEKVFLVCIIAAGWVAWYGYLMYGRCSVMS